MFIFSLLFQNRENGIQFTSELLDIIYDLVAIFWLWILLLIFWYCVGYIIPRSLGRKLIILLLVSFQLFPGVF